MNKKILINIIGAIFIFLIGFIIHNLYDWFPNIFISIISPVNESIFEHIKLIFTSYIIWLIVKYFIYKNNNLEENNLILKEVITTLFSIILFLIIFLPINLEKIYLLLCLYIL